GACVGKRLVQVDCRHVDSGARQAHGDGFADPLGGSRHDRHTFGGLHCDSLPNGPEATLLDAGCQLSKVWSVTPRVRSTLKCPLFIAHDLSGFAFPSALTEGARRATEVSAENRRAPLKLPLFGPGSLAWLPRRRPLG